MRAPPLRAGVASWLHLGAWSLFFVLFWSRSFGFDDAGNLWAGHPHLWADWAIHFTLGNAMAERELVPTTSPLLAGHPLAYPFAADLGSALLMRAGVSMVRAFVVPSLLCSLLLVLALFRFLRTIFRSDAVAVVGSNLFLLAGGIGFVDFARDVAASPHPLALLAAPPHEYTRLPERGIVLVSILDGIVIPQRSFTLGFPFALLALAEVFATLVDREPDGAAHPLTVGRKLRLAAAALVLGLMPIVHPHTLLAAFVILGCWAIGDVASAPAPERRVRGLPWAAVAAMTAAVAAPLLHRFVLGHVGSGFVRWYPGWYARELQVSWPRFWLANRSVAPLLALAGLAPYLARRGSRAEAARAALTVLPFFLLFALVNLFLLAPWIYDDTKVLAWADVGLSGLAATAVVALWRAARSGGGGQGGSLHAGLARTAAALLLAAAVASGAIDAWRTLRADLHRHVMYTAEDLRLASWGRRATRPESTWLTGDRHNHWVSNLTGRQTVMAYRGWLWSQGYDFAPVERDVARMLETADAALLERYGVDYAVLGPDERQRWHASDRAFERFPVAARSESYTVYRIR